MIDNEKYEVKCCYEHGTFMIDQRLHDKLDAFFALGDSFIESGDLMLMPGMMLLASNIVEFDEWPEVGKRYVHLGYGQQVALIGFLGIASKSFQREIIEKRKRYKREIEIITGNKDNKGEPC